MKKIYSILLSAALLATSSVATAQQLPNGGFESWKSACGSTEAFGEGGSGLKYSSPKTGEMRQRPGYEPTDWNGSSINQKVSISTKKQELVTKETGSVASGSAAVKMENVWVGAMGIGSVAPGFITFGTPWVYAVSTLDECDGGVYGGVSFTYKPDAITGMYKRTDSNTENSYIIAYLWNGTYTSKVGKKSSPTQDRNNEVRGIFGKVSASGNGKLVAKCEKTFSTTNGEWQRITVPLEYVEGAGAPTMMNVIVSGGNYWDRTSLQEKTTLYADEIDFVYYSRLEDLKVNGLSVDGFSSDVYTYNMAGTELPTEDQIDAMVMGQTAIASVSVNADNATVTVEVVNVGKDLDGQVSHAYVLQYEKAVKEGVSTEYPGYLNGKIYDADLDEWAPFAENEEKTITITEYRDGTCDFLLPNLALASLELELGDIKVEGATVAADGQGGKTYAGYVEGMPLFGGELIADVTLNGTIDALGEVNMNIDVVWEGLPIVCTFTTKMATSIGGIVVEDTVVEYYNLQGLKVANPSNGVFIRVANGKATKVLVK